MNGPEHYRIAEELLRSATVGQDDVAEDGTPIPTYPAWEYDPDTARDINTVGNALAAAQVHATLAHAAAVVSPTSDWSKAIALRASVPRVRA